MRVHPHESDLVKILIESTIDMNSNVDTDHLWNQLEKHLSAHKNKATFNLDDRKLIDGLVESICQTNQDPRLTTHLTNMMQRFWEDRQPDRRWFDDVNQTASLLDPCNKHPLMPQAQAVKELKREFWKRVENAIMDTAR